MFKPIGQLLSWLKKVFLRIWRVVLSPFYFVFRILLWPFRAKGVLRQRFFLAVVVVLALLSAVAAYPKIWNKPVNNLSSKLDYYAGRVHKSWAKKTLLALKPEAAPATFLGRDLSQYALGLDLIGGAHLEYKIDTSKVAPQDVSDALSALRDTIERRVNIFGVKEPVVQLAKVGQENRLIVEMAGVSDLKSAIAKVGDPIFLEFKEERPAGEIPATGPNGQPLNLNSQQLQDPNLLFKATQLTGQYLKRAQVVFDYQTNQPQVELTFNGEGAKLFDDITKRNVNKRIAIFLDGVPVTAPTVQQEISDGTAVITGSFTVDQAKALSLNLNAGALPVPISLISEQTVGSTLGAQSLHRIIEAGVATLALIILFMVFIYRLPGLLALLSLGFYILFILALFKLAPVTLSLSGIAGVVLSVGMAVDANILIFARFREEKKQGREIPAAVEEGFKRAWPAIRDSNVSTILTTIILYTVSTSFVRGFALTLGLGVVLSMFTAVFISRYLLREAVRHPRFLRIKRLW